MRRGGMLDRATPVINAVDGAPEPDLETLIAMDAELFVTISWAVDDVWSFTSREAYLATQQAVPIVAISVAGLADANMQRFVELAGLLGADLETPELVQAKDDLETAVAAFSELATEKAGLTSLFGTVGVDADGWNAAYPPDWADLAWNQSLGMTVVEPNVKPGLFWENLSLEQALKYPSDIFFNSTRAGRATPEQLRADPVFGSHPAVAAGQIGSWNQDFILSYQGMKAALDTMIATLTPAQNGTA